MDLQSNRGDRTPNQPTVPMNILQPRRNPVRRVLFQDFPDDDEGIDMDTTLEIEYVSSSSGKSKELQDMEAATNERFLIRKVCREFLVNCGGVDERIIQSQFFTPMSWIGFREYTEEIGRIQIGRHLIVSKHNGVLVKHPSMKPICSFPTCFSTDGTTESPDRRCVLHGGGSIGFAVLELQFSEEISGVKVAVGIEHVHLMFPYDSRQMTETQLLGRVVSEYENFGLMKNTCNRLKKSNLKRAAEKLCRTKVAPIRRYWIFLESSSEASKHYYKIAMAAGLAVKANGNQPLQHGDLAGQHVEILKPDYLALEGQSRFDMNVKRELSEQINNEQMLSYGVAEKITLCY